MLKAQRRELESRLESADGAEQAQLQLELAVCIEDMLSAAVVAKKAGAERKAKPSNPETPYDAWVSQDNEDNSETHRRLKQALDKVRNEGVKTAKQREYWDLYNEKHLTQTEIARIYGVAPSCVSRTLARARANMRRLGAQYNQVVDNIERGVLFPAEGVGGTAYQAELLRQYRDGVTMKELAQSYGITQSSVSRTLAKARASEEKLLSLAEENGDGPTDEATLDLTDLRVLEFLQGVLSPRMQMITYLRLCEALTYEKITELIGLSKIEIQTAESWAYRRIADRLQARAIKLKNPDVLPMLVNDAYTRMEREPAVATLPMQEKVREQKDPPAALSRKPETAITPVPESEKKRAPATTEKSAHPTKKGRPKTKVMEEFSVGVEYSDGRSIDAGDIDRYAGTELSPFMRRMASAAKQRVSLMKMFLTFLQNLKFRWRYAK